jgi:hypothetical protein|tara:strand:- start:666 stop:914 length:249 start_codon:yes stop_codon:yes gene_type:complete
MSNQNNVLPFPTKMDSTLLEFRQVISKLLILEAQMMKMLDEVDNVEKECYILMERRDELLMDLERKDLIDTAMEVVQKQYDD